MFTILGKLRKSQREMWEILKFLSSSGDRIRVEIENSLERFTSRLVVSKGAVFIDRPPQPTFDMTPGSHIRVLLPGADRRELRLRVLDSRMNIGPQTMAFVCKPARQIPTRRIHDRYSVRRYRNLRLWVAGRRYRNVRLRIEDESFRVVDVSVSGCRVILTSAQSQQLLPLGEVIRRAELTVGSRMTIHLERVIPRCLNGHMVGCEFVISRDGLSDPYMKRLIASLDKKEKDRRAS
jgi:hypothetical protein